MDRRTLFTKFRKSKGAKVQTAPPMVMTLNPYTGPFGKLEAAHLLRRSMFGPTFEQIEQAEADGLSGTITKLFAPQPPPVEPIYFNYDDDPNVPAGTTWVNTPPDSTVNSINGARRRSLYSWWIGLMLEGGVSIREKMTLFWREHFVTANISRNQYNYHYSKTLRDHALGNFKTLTEEITISPSMLIYLNGTQNSNRNPNENYSRELLELFTLGRGELAGPGDYTNYTELDVAELAKALTGWISADRNDRSAIGGVYVPTRHDTSTKQLSNRLGNAMIQNGDENEYKDVIDIIFQQDEVSRFICRQLHIWFVGANIDAAVEANVIEPMAQILRTNNYEIQPAVEALLSSEYFFDESHRGCMVNHPIDFLMKLAGSLEFPLPNDLELRYNGWNFLYGEAVKLDMNLYSIDTVAGWKAFYQGPAYYDVWINSVTLPLREELVDVIMAGFGNRGNRAEYDYLDIISKFSNPTDPNDLINDLATVLFCYPISQGQLTFLKEVLLPGLPDFEWTVEYGEHLADPDDDQKREGVVRKLEALFGTMLKMPEMYLI